MKYLQNFEDLNKWHQKKDPWAYNENPDDKKRKEILLSEIPIRTYTNVLDIGCGQGFITKDLPGAKIFGLDLSPNAIKFAETNERNNIQYKVGSIFNVCNLYKVKFDLIIITGVLYPQYIGDSSNLIYLLIDQLLNPNGILITVHIDQWYNCKFPYLRSKQVFYQYRQYFHNLEIYMK